MSILHSVMQSIFAGWNPKKISENLTEMAETANRDLRNGYIELEDFKLEDGASLRCYFNYLDDSGEVVDRIDYVVNLVQYPLDKLEKYIANFSGELKAAFEENEVTASDDCQCRYRFNGIAYYNGRPLGEFNLATIANSEKAAIRNFKFQIIQQLGFNVKEMNSITFSNEDIVIEDILDLEFVDEETDADVNLESDPQTAWGYID